MLKQLPSTKVVKVVRPATDSEIASPEAGTLCYYISLPFYKHSVFKCAGLMHSDEPTRLWYLNHWMEGKHESPIVPRSVMIMKGDRGQIPDRIELVDGDWIEHSLPM